MILASFGSFMALCIMGEFGSSSGTFVFGTDSSFSPRIVALDGSGGLVLAAVIFAPEGDVKGTLPAGDSWELTIFQNALLLGNSGTDLKKKSVVGELDSDGDSATGATIRGGSGLSVVALRVAN